jgi:hypothetical protein
MALEFIGVGQTRDCRPSTGRARPWAAESMLAGAREAA